jgi:hypothetical protein
MASMAKAEQVGTNRQQAGRAGRKAARYALTSAISTRAKSVGRAVLAGGPDLQSSLEFGGRLGIREVVRAGLGDDDNVCRSRDLVAAMAENFPDQAFHAVARDGAANPRADRDAETRTIRGAGVTHDDEVRRMPGPPCALHSEEVPATTEPRRLGKGRVAHHPITPAASAACSR